MTDADKRKVDTAFAAAAKPMTMMTEQAEQAITMAKASFDHMATKSKDAMEKGIKTVNAMTEMNRGNVEALLDSSRVAMSGLQVMASNVADYSRQSFERANAVAPSIARARTVPELMQLQYDVARAEFANAVAEYSKLSQSMFQTMSAMLEPLQKRVVSVAEIKDLLKDA